MKSDNDLISVSLGKRFPQDLTPAPVCLFSRFYAP